MELNLASLSVLILCAGLLVLQVGGSELRPSPRERQRAKQQQPQQRLDSASDDCDDDEQRVGQPVSASALSAASSSASLAAGDSQQEERAPLSGSRLDEPDNLTDATTDRPAQPRGRRPSTRRPSASRRVYQEPADDDEDCYEPDDNYDYRTLFRDPMDQLSRMISSVMDRMQMPGMASEDDYSARPIRGGLAASASAFATNDGGSYSKLASSVTNNGRTRGVVSETRNGRTKTRRIGPADEDDFGERAD